MRNETGERRGPSPDAIQAVWEADADLDAWTLDELDDELGAMRPAFSQRHDAEG